MTVQREMTLVEYVERLPEIHLARRQLNALRSQLAAVTKQRDELVVAVLAVCCDPEGRIVIRGSDGDRAELQAALAKVGAGKTGEGS